MAQGVTVPHCIVLDEVEGFPNEKLAAHPVECAQLFGCFFQQATCKHVMNCLHGPAHVELSAFIPEPPLWRAKGWGRTRRLPLISPLKVFWTLREGFLLASLLKDVEGFSCPRASES